MKRFEYKIEKLSIDLDAYDLGAYGNDGWELVNVLRFGHIIEYIFKRELI